MVIKHTSKNGLRIVLETVPAVRSVAIGIWVLAGSRNETVKNNGISHFIEHMFFKGTKNRTAQEIAEAFDAIGGEVNAFTSKEYTCYYTRILDIHKEYALEILADMFFNSVFEEEEIEREKKVIIEEINMYDDTPDDIVDDLLALASYGQHPFGFPILGTEEKVRCFTQKTIKDYLNQHYIPNNVVISVAGNVTESFIATVEGYFEHFTSQRTSNKVEQPIFLINELVRYKETEQIHLCLGYNGYKIDNNYAYSLVILNNIFGGNMSSRLFQEVREKKGLAYAVYSDHESFLDHGIFTIYAATRPDQLSELKETIKLTINLLLKEGITQKELENSKEQLKGNLILGLESTDSRMARNGENELLLNQHVTIDQMIDEIDEVSLESVQHVINSIFEKSPSIALVGPK